jgi:DNA-damage-inducible protein J
MTTAKKADRSDTGASPSKAAKKRSASAAEARPYPSPPRSIVTKPIVRRTRAAKPANQKTTMLHVRIEEQVKAEATAIFDSIGISLSEALRVFLKRTVSEKGFPFDLEVPNTVTRAAMKEARTLGRRFASAQELFDDLEKGAER